MGQEFHSMTAFDATMADPFSGPVNFGIMSALCETRMISRLILSMSAVVIPTVFSRVCCFL